MENEDDRVKITAKQNYSTSSPWPEKDNWHKETFFRLQKIVNDFLEQYATESSIILNAGSGGTEYSHVGKMIHMDIIEDYISKYENAVVGSIENIPLSDSSVDIAICVGSVLNYADAQKSLLEFSRVLKPDGLLLLEFERSDSAEFLFTKRHHKKIFMQKYIYCGQEHLLWLYSEKSVRKILKLCHFETLRVNRFHTISSLLFRFGLSEYKAARFIKWDPYFHILSYPFAHNCVMFAKKISCESI